MRRKSRVGMVTFNATVLATGSAVFEISQRINSANTAASAMVVEKDKAAIRLRRVVVTWFVCDCRGLGGEFEGWSSGFDNFC